MSPNPALLTVPHKAAGTTYQAAVLADGPLAYLRMGDSTTPTVDSIGTFSPSSSTWPTLGAAGLGDAATSASFDGTDDVITLGSNSRTITAWTVEALINPTTVTGARTLFCINPASPAIWFYIENGAMKARPANGSFLASGSVLSASTLYHVACTYDGSTMTMYRNGSSVYSTAATGSYATGANTWAVGAAAGLHRYTGLMGGWAVHMSALTSARILAHAQAAGVA